VHSAVVENNVSPQQEREMGHATLRGNAAINVVHLGLNATLIFSCITIYTANNVIEYSAECQRKQAVRVATRYAPPLSSPVGAPVPRAPPNRRNVAVVSHAEYILTVTATPASRDE